MGECGFQVYQIQRVLIVTLPLETSFLSLPGPIDQDYAGPWNYTIANQLNISYGLSTEESQPLFLGYLPLGSVNSVIYDDQRQALYAMYQAQYPDYSQNMRLYFVISRDNGQTWSQPIDIRIEFEEQQRFRINGFRHRYG